MKDLKINSGLLNLDGSFTATLPTGTEFKFAFDAFVEDATDIENFTLRDLDMHTIAPVNNPTVSREVSETIISGLLGEEEGKTWLNMQREAAKQALFNYLRNPSTVNEKPKPIEDSVTYTEEQVQEMLAKLQNDIVNKLSSVVDDIEDNYVGFNEDNYGNTFTLKVDIATDSLMRDITDTVGDVFDEFIQDAMPVNNDNQ